MNSADFRRHAHDVVDWMADYLDGVEEFPVKAQVRPGEIAGRLPQAPPEAAEPMEEILGDFRSLIVPGMTHWQHPKFFAYFQANSSRPSVLAEMLTATLAAQCMIWDTSPAATELEERMMGWLRLMIGLPEGFVGSIQDTASTATLCAILAARERVSQFAVNESGMSDAGVFTAYCSTETHSSIEKDVKIAGIGRANLRKIAVDSEFGIDPEALESAIAADVAAGRRPVCVVATLGTTGVSGFDPLRAVGEVCDRHGIWLHVDAAWAGSALLLPEQRWMIDGVEYADSFVFNPHKWLFTNFDCSAFFVRDPAALVRTFEILPEYLKTRDGAAVTNFRDWGVPLGRRFRALKLWFVIRSYGVDGLRRMIRGHIDLAQELAATVDGSEDFELLRPPVLSLFCFRYRPKGMDEQGLDEANERLLHAVNDSGKLYLTHTRINGVYAIRFVVGQTATEPRHVREAWQTVQELARLTAAAGR
jgi:aromatic-L-amino-acid decarboxylase